MHCPRCGYFRLVYTQSGIYCFDCNYEVVDLSQNDYYYYDPYDYDED